MLEEISCIFDLILAKPNDDCPSNGKRWLLYFWRSVIYYKNLETMGKPI